MADEKSGIRNHRVSKTPKRVQKAQARQETPRKPKEHPNLWRLPTVAAIFAGGWAFFHGLAHVTALNTIFFGLEIVAMGLLLLLLVVSVIEKEVKTWYRWVLAIVMGVITAPHIIILLLQVH